MKDMPTILRYSTYFELYLHLTAQRIKACQHKGKHVSIKTSHVCRFGYIFWWMILRFSRNVRVIFKNPFNYFHKNELSTKCQSGFVTGDYCASRSRHLEVFCKKGVLRNFAKFTEKHLCQSLVFNNVAGLRPATLFQKRLWHMCFPVITRFSNFRF